MKHTHSSFRPQQPRIILDVPPVGTFGEQLAALVLFARIPPEVASIDRETAWHGAMRRSQQPGAARRILAEALEKRGSRA